MQTRRAALYLRVSTDRQETECQRPEVEQLARTRGFEVVKVFEETMSAAKVRPEDTRMMKEARRTAFDVIVETRANTATGNLSVSFDAYWRDHASPALDSPLVDRDARLDCVRARYSRQPRIARGQR
jgi:hypothetical protein